MLRWVLAISILFPWVVHANDSTLEEQKQAIERMFAGEDPTSEPQRFGSMYVRLIQENLTNKELYKGSMCRVNVRLHPSGTVRKVVILPEPTNIKTPMNELLCNEVFLAVYRVKQFPMPQQMALRNKLQNINLTVIPN
ncbi:TPA: cell envelope integrity protein TolA [Vibrio fluvialis]|nr:cell envelope integrity protein TolA [Vibrio fluvialis]